MFRNKYLRQEHNFYCHKTSIWTQDKLARELLRIFSKLPLYLHLDEEDATEAYLLPALNCYKRILNKTYNLIVLILPKSNKILNYLMSNQNKSFGLFQMATFSFFFWFCEINRGISFLN